MNIQEKESLIIGTIINCNKEIKKYLNESKQFNKSKFVKLYESKFADVYHYNMVSLYGDIMNVPLFELSESYEFPNAVLNEHNNYYSYFKKVYSFLNGYENNVQNSLNESLQNSDGNGFNLDINNFRKSLKIIIDKLEKQNDVDNYSSEILRIKTFAKQPLFVYGFNICNNLALMAEIQKSFGYTVENLFVIVYSRLNKELIFFYKSGVIIKYSIVEDKFENNLCIKFEPEKYLETLKNQFDDNTLLELYVNVKSLNIKFTDNLYRDLTTAAQLKNNSLTESLIQH